MTTIRKEVEQVLAREVIGHEKAIVAHFANRGLDARAIALAMMEQHVANQRRLVEAHQRQLADLEAELARLK